MQTGAISAAGSNSATNSGAYLQDDHGHGTAVVGVIAARKNDAMEIYESHGGTYGLGRRNHEHNHVGSPFLNYALAINEALPKEFRRVGTGPEYARAIRRAHQNAKSR